MARVVSLWAVGTALWCAGASASLLPLEAERLRASVGGYAVMNCHLDFPFGTEIPYHLQWEKDGETILSWYSGEGAGGAAGVERVADRWGGRLRRLAAGDPARGLGRGSINVTAVRETDAGLYRCRVSFPNRTPPERNNGTFYRLDVDGGNIILTPPVNVTVLEGERAELECLPKNPEATVQWHRDETPLQHLPELAARADLPRNGSLVLRHALSADPGQYSCRVRDPDGTTQSAAAYLDVQYKAKVVYAPAERYLPYGKPASLDCHFSANPPLTNLRWEKDGFLFDPYNVQGVFYSRNGSLLFNQVDESHEGDYSCTPYNALGSAGASPAVRVRVQRAPALAARPQPLYVARLGDSLTLPCAAEPEPGGRAPRLHWTRKDGAPLPVGRHSVADGNLTLSDVRAEDRGVYVCAAHNEAAAVAAEAELLVENLPPRAPHDLAARAASRTVHLSWAPGHSGQEVEYQVWYRERAESEWHTMKILSRGVTDATLLGLRPGTDYELRVLSQDHIGDGLFSKPVFVTTLDSDAEETATAYAVSVTEVSPAVWVAEEAGEAAEGTEEALGGPLDELDVSVRLLDDGALVRWRRADGDTSRCSLRWYRGDYLLATAHTHHDYLLVSEVEEGESYRARVMCASGAAGAAALRVPEYGRLRAVAAGCAGAALLLAAAAAALYLARARLPRLARRPRAH